MALGVTKLYKWTDLHTGEFISIIQVVGDTAYPNTGSTIGYAITASMFDFSCGFASTSDFSAYQTGQGGPPTIHYFQLGNTAAPSSAGGFTKIDTTTGNLRMFGSTGTEVTNGSDASAVGGILMAWGH